MFVVLPKHRDGKTCSQQCAGIILSLPQNVVGNGERMVLIISIAPTLGASDGINHRQERLSSLVLSWSLAISGGEACGLDEAVEQSTRDFHHVSDLLGRFKTGAPQFSADHRQRIAEG